MSRLSRATNNSPSTKCLDERGMTDQPQRVVGPMRSLRALACAVLAASLGVIAIGGPIDPPPGPVGPTYKTLTEVEPRRIVNATNTPGNASSMFIISQPGSYYFDRNLTVTSVIRGISITTGGVTLDLNGFTLDGGEVGEKGIVILTASPDTQVRITNGVIKGWQNLAIETQDLGRTIIENVRISHAGIEPALVARSAEVIDCDVSAINGGGGAMLCTDSVIRKSRFYGGVFAAHSIVEENTFGSSTPGEYAIDLVESSATLPQCVFRNNDVIATASGNGVNVTLTGHIVEGNRISSRSSASANIGLFTTPGSSNCIITGNIVKDFADNYNLSGSGHRLDLILAQLPETINLPANVTLAGSLTAPSGVNGITITADNVNIDLGGHTLTGSGVSTGIVTTAPERRAISIANGTIRGFANGIVLDASSGTSIRNVTVSGVAERGIVANFVATVDDCKVTSVGTQGIVVSNGSSVRNNLVSRAGTIGNFDGITVGADSLVERNTVTLSGGDNIQVGQGTTVRNNTVASAIVGRGINATDANLIENNNVRGNSLDGIAVGFACKVISNNLSGNGTAAGQNGGILATGRQNEIVENHCSFEDFGIYVTGTRNIVSRNTSGEPTSGTNYNIVPGNAFGPIVNVAGANNFVGVANSTHPQANFEK